MLGAGQATDCWFDEPLYQAMNEHRPFDPGGYARRLNELPGDWPPPQALGPQ